MTCYPTQSHYPDAEPTSPCPILIMPRAYINFKVIGLTRTRRVGVRTRKVWIPQSPSMGEGRWGALLIRLHHPVWLSIVMPASLEDAQNITANWMLEIAFSASHHVIDCWSFPSLQHLRSHLLKGKFVLFKDVSGAH